MMDKVYIYKKYPPHHESYTVLYARIDKLEKIIKRLLKELEDVGKSDS
jgi:hypothetical protein